MSRLDALCRRCLMAGAGVLLMGVVVTADLPAAMSSEGSQLTAVRSRIRGLESRLAELEQASLTAQQEREALDAQLALAEARVRELELLLTSSRDEAVRLRAEIAKLAGELDRRRAVVRRHLEMMALLGRPGPVQLLADALEGGDLDDAIATVSLLTAGQMRLMQELTEVERQRNERLGELSRILGNAELEARELIARRNELEAVRTRVEEGLRRLERSRSAASNELDDLRAREAALSRLMKVVTGKQRVTGAEDIRRFRGALPWPAAGKVARTFGRHYLPRYATYTVCNGLRLDVPSGAEVGSVFGGVVAYAQYFKGYGNMVVVDHGHDVYSLVAGLATIHVRVDQRVGMGTRLGLASPPSEDGNVYLEIRVGSTPQDPRRWLQLKGGGP